MIMTERKTSLVRPLLWAVTIAIGFDTVWCLAAVWLFATIDSASKRAEGDVWEHVVVRSDGTPLIRRTPYNNQSLTTCRDLSGQPQEAPDQSHVLTAVYMSPEQRNPGFFADQPGWEHRLKSFVNERDPGVHWYFVHDGKPEGAGYFVGYERVSNRRVGFIGLLGFRSDAVPADEWIPVRSSVMDYSQWTSAPNWIVSRSSWDPPALRPGQGDIPPHLVHVPSGNRLRLVDLAARTVSTVFETPEPIAAVGVPELLSSAQGTASKEQPILVRTGQQIKALDHKYQVTRIFKIPSEADRQSTVIWYEIGNGQAIAEFSGPGTPRRALNASRQTIYKIATDGTIQDQFEVILQDSAPGLGQQMGTLLLAVAVPVPAIVVVIEPLMLMGIEQAQSYPAAVSTMLRDSWSSLLVVFALAFVLAALAKRRGRAFGLSQREQYVWAVVVVLLGIPAYVGFLLYRRWPVRLPCPNCHARAPRDRALCAECGTRFPDPALKGIEIFA
jgi:hypothetical protein